MNKLKSKRTVILIILTVLLAVTAVGTSLWLYWLNTRPVAPTAPASKRKAAAQNLSPLLALVRLLVRLRVRVVLLLAGQRLRLPLRQNQGRRRLHLQER